MQIEFISCRVGREEKETRLLLVVDDRCVRLECMVRNARRARRGFQPSMSASDFARHLRLLLESSSDAPPLSTLLEEVDAFVLNCSSSPEAEPLIAQAEDDLQRIHHDTVDHALFRQTEIFLSVLFHLRPLLPPPSLISTWFELVLRPALREPKLPTSAVNHAKELILSALDPIPGAIDDSSGEDETERDKRREKVGNFRRRLMDLYLLDAYNESSGDDVLELAELDEVQREKKACWKSNLEDVLVRVGLQRPYVSMYWRHG